MGFKNKKIKKDFTPIDLNEENVQTIFKRCLATDSTEQKQSSVLFSALYGFEESSTSIYFDKQKLAENKEAIQYLYGQVETIHSNKYSFAPSDLSKKYSSLPWTNNKRYFNGVLTFRRSICFI